MPICSLCDPCVGIGPLPVGWYTEIQRRLCLTTSLLQIFTGKLWGQVSASPPSMTRVAGKRCILPPSVALWAERPHDQRSRLFVTSTQYERIQDKGSHTSRLDSSLQQQWDTAAVAQSSVESSKQVSQHKSGCPQRAQIADSKERTKHPSLADCHCQSNQGQHACEQQGGPRTSRLDPALQQQWDPAAMLT